MLLYFSKTKYIFLIEEEICFLNRHQSMSKRALLDYSAHNAAAKLNVGAKLLVLLKMAGHGQEKE